MENKRAQFLEKELKLLHVQNTGRAGHRGLSSSDAACATCARSYQNKNVEAESKRAGVRKSDGERENENSDHTKSKQEFRSNRLVEVGRRE